MTHNLLYVPRTGCSGSCFCTGRCRQPEGDPLERAEGYVKRWLERKDFVEALRAKPRVRVKAGSAR